MYRDGMTKQGIASAVARAAQAFPAMSEEQLDILTDRMIENRFTDMQALDAVNHVIDTYEGWGKQPNIANFISFDVQVKTYTHRQVCAEDLWEAVEAIDVGQQKPRWAKKEDIERYKLKRWNRRGA